MVRGNPTSGDVTLEFMIGENAPVHLLIRDVEGRVVLRESLAIKESDHLHRVDMSGAGKGIYFFECIREDGEKAVFKIAVN